MRNNRVKPSTLSLMMIVILILVCWIYDVYDDKQSIEYDIELYKIALCNKDTVIMNLSKKYDSLEKSKKIPEIIFTHPEKKRKKIPIDSHLKKSYHHFN